VQPGFLAEMAALQAAAAARPETAGAAPAATGADLPASGAARAGRKALGSAPLPKDLEDRRKEAEALARFLLENLS
jgi:hypothetical protein